MNDDRRNPADFRHPSKSKGPSHMKPDVSYASTCTRERGSREVLKRHLRGYLSYFGDKRKVLDLGCGRGEFIELLRENGHESVGLEPDSELAQEARKSGAKVIRGYAGPFLDKTAASSYDGLFLCHVIEHVAPLEAAGWMVQAARVLRPGGVLVVVTPNPLSIGVMTHSFWRDPTHIRPYPKDLIVELAGRAGLELVDSGERCLHQPSLFSKALRLLRRCLVGDYFRDPDLFVVVRKPSDRG